LTLALTWIGKAGQLIVGIIHSVLEATEEIILGTKRPRLAEKRTVTISPAALDALTRRVAAFSGRQFVGAVYGRRLSPADRTPLRLREAGVTYAEIGRALAISTAAAKQRVYRLRRPRISNPG
jgi:hypothetical protein